MGQAYTMNAVHDFQSMKRMGGAVKMDVEEVPKTVKYDAYSSPTDLLPPPPPPSAYKKNAPAPPPRIALERLVVTPIEFERGSPVDTTFNFKNAQDCVRKNTKGYMHPVKLYEGSFGKIFAFCDKEDRTCKSKIVKITWIQNRILSESVQREMYIFSRLHNSGLTPRIYDTFFCGSYFYILMQQLKSDMYDRALEQAQIMQPKLRELFMAITSDREDWVRYFLPYTVVYTQTQIQRMFNIAYELGAKYGIIHGDLKPDQYLTNDVKPFESKSIVVTDFGFSGTLEQGKWHAKYGWNHVKGCAAFERLPPPYESRRIQEAYVKWFNVYQLAYYFQYTKRITLVIDLDTKKLRMFHYRSPSLYVALGIPLEFIQHFGRFCNDFPPQDWPEFDDFFPHPRLPEVVLSPVSSL